jgi:thiamine-phosphate pyrophosphorylase
MRLIVITSSRNIPDEASILTSFFEKGLPTLHLSKPNYSTPKMASLIRNIPERFHNRIIIHSHHNLMFKFDLKGVHLTKKHKRRRLLTWITLKMLRSKKPEFLTSTSYTKLANILESFKPYSYVFLSPVFNSDSSKYQAGYTEHSLKGAIQKTLYKVVARGGIDVQHIEKVQEIGFYGLAIRSDIWDSPDPLSILVEYLNKFKELGIPVE